MTRKSTQLLAVVLAATFAIQGFAGAQGGSKGAKQAPYMHVVVFYLKKDAPKNAAQGLIEDSHKLLAKIPTVRQLWVGRPAEQSTPKVAVTDYAVALTIAFDNYDGLKSYIDHDLHQEYLKRNGSNIEKVLVYDFVNQMK